MRSVLMGFNMSALGASLIPAVLIIQSLSQTRGVDSGLRDVFYFLCGGAGLMCLAALAAMTKHRRPSPAAAGRLMVAAAALAATAIAWSIGLWFALGMAQARL